MSHRFDSDTAHDLGTATYAPLSDAGHRPPSVHFVCGDDGATLCASPPGARIACECDTDGRSRVRIRDMRPGHAGEHIADVTVWAPEDATLTEETIAVASAIYWSWWRARDMHGEAP